MKFCIVVPNLNYGKFIDACLSSIERQIGVDVEVLIIDGGSTDSSRSIAEKYCERNAWGFVEKVGLGQADSIAYGLLPENWSEENEDTIYGWLNSDDTYLRSDSLRIVAEQFEKFFDIDVVSLGGYFLERDGSPEAPVNYDYHPLIRGNVFARGGGFLQPATFWRSSVNRDIRIDTSFKYVFDGDYFLRMRRSGFNFYVNPRIHIAGYRLHGSNLSLNVPAQRVAELSVLYRNTLLKRGSARYLMFISFLLRMCDFIPVIGGYLKKIIRTVNNTLSYLTRYVVPSI